MVIGDEEKSDSGKCNSLTLNYLKENLFDFRVVDLSFTGNQFTWTNRRSGRNCRLDRGITNISWRLLSSKTTIYHFETVTSNHCPIVLDTNPKYF